MRPKSSEPPSSACRISAVEVTGTTETVTPGGANFCQYNIEEAWFLA